MQDSVTRDSMESSVEVSHTVPGLVEASQEFTIIFSQKF